MEDKEKARQIFFDNSCRHFFIYDAGKGDEYNKLGATREDEKEWRQEYIQHWTGKLSVIDLEAVDRLRSAIAAEAIPSLIEISDQGDSFEKLSFANALCDLSGGGYMPFWVLNPVNARGLKKAIHLWQAILANPLRFDVARSFPSTNVWKASTVEEYVLSFARQQVETTKHNIGFWKFLLC
jgi:hypothetical protein